VCAGATSTVIAGQATSGYTDGVGTVTKFYNPGHLAVSTSGSLYVADVGNSVIRRINLNGKKLS
jgi:hypothetical protein